MRVATESEESQDQFGRLPGIFVFELTRRCNHRCLYCYTVWGEPSLGYPGSPHDELSTPEIQALIAKLRNEAPVDYIALSGGEPLLREDLPEIVQFIRKCGITPIIITNGTLLTEERVAATMVGGCYEISLHSYRAEVHDRMSGRHGAWNKVIEGMANIRRAGGQQMAVFVATKLNYMDLFRTAELAIALGCWGMLYNRVNLGAYNWHYADELLPTPAMIQEDLDMLEEIGSKYAPFAISVSIVIEPCVVDLTRYKHIYFGFCPKGGTNSYFTIDPAGNIRTCNHSPVVLGNLKTDQFSEIFRNHPYVCSFRQNIPAECAHCAPALKNICRGGCDAAAEQCYGTASRVDPFVSLSRR